ncbi:MAG: acetoacetate--CoA ligase, partial [Gammaproteobacteria bacterium]|nr:acetoacetate--CoA ligase [Gammaproteobacteria bacterium]
YPVAETVRALALRLPDLAAVVRVPCPGRADRVGASEPPAATCTERDWQSLLAEPAPAAFHAAAFDHPVYILWSSGTTGPPKGIVHGAGGTLLQHMKEQLLHTDLRRGDRLFYYTTCGWMMWNWLVSGLASGATLLLYDGSPTHPDPGALWQMAAEEGITIFGTSPRYLAGLARAGVEPGRRFRLPVLRTLLSTGAPLPPESFDFVSAAISSEAQLCSISGGTDIVSCFVLGNPLLPVRRGEIQCAGLGMAVDVVDDDGRSLPPGERGELVCRRPFPSMPVGFWDDPDGARYRRAYFSRFPGIWTHGDHAERTVAGGFVLHGRSDAVLNPGGVRMGTAEIYRAVSGVPEVEESLAVGQRWQGDERVVLFVVLGPGHVLDESLADRIRQAIRSRLSPRHVPARIVAVPDLPRTRNGKLAELDARAALLGEAPANEAALANA